MSNLPPFAVRLRGLRDAAGLTQEKLAEAAGLHRQTIAQLETGVRKPSWETVQTLAAALGVDCRAFCEPPKARKQRRKE